MAKYLILACDGGGVRGYISASVLQHLVSDPQVGDFLSHVSLYSGTSTGSFIALGLAAGVGIDTIQSQYQQASAATIFTPNPNLTNGVAAAIRARLAPVRQEAVGGIWNDILKYLEYLIYSSYSTTGIQGVAQKLLQDATLSALRPVLVNTLQLCSSATSPGVWTPLALHNLSGSNYGSLLAWEAALCSGAAPIYFPPYSPTSVSLGYCADGGLFANNPSLAAVLAARGTGIPLEDICLLSLDTGTSPDGMPGAVIDGWGGGLDMGPIQWLFPAAMMNNGTCTPKFPLLSALMDASASAIMSQVAMLLGDQTFRVTVPLTGPVALDDTSTSAYDTMDASLRGFYSSPGYTNLVTWLRKYCGDLKPNPAGS